jgi:preprotein translocase SecE subunit
MGISTYLKETKVELTHVSWPTRRQSILFTVLVIAVSLATAFFLGFFDFLFSRILSYFIS